MLNTTKYPAWQTKIREAQANMHAKRLEAAIDDAWNAAERQREKTSKIRAELAEAGLELPDSTVAKWRIDDYEFEAIENRDYRTILYIRKRVPGAVDREDLHETGYVAVVFDSVNISHYFSGDDIANAIDYVDRMAREQVDINVRVLADIEKHQQHTNNDSAEVDSRVEIATTPEERLANVIYDIVREVMREQFGFDTQNSWLEH